MVEAYSLNIDVPRSTWLSSLGTEKPERRARVRHTLRQAVGRRAWLRAKAAGASRVRRFALVVSVRGRPGDESPILADETLKPLIDAGTDVGMWADDDPKHRILTVYIRDPRPARHPSVALTVIPVPKGMRATDLFVHASKAGAGVLRRLVVPDGMWVTSNDSRLPAEDIRSRIGAISRASKSLWANAALGGSVSVLCSIGYPWVSRYPGDPDNTAQSCIAMYGQGVLQGAVPPEPSMFGFCLDGRESDPHTHVITMLVLKSDVVGGDLVSSFLNAVKGE